MDIGFPGRARNFSEIILSYFNCFQISITDASTWCSLKKKKIKIFIDFNHFELCSKKLEIYKEGAVCCNFLMEINPDIMNIWQI
jgi:hypothetical protein